MNRVHRFLVLGLLAAAVPLAGCGGGGSRPVVAPPPSSTQNVQAIQVNTGPTYQAPTNPYPYINGAFTSVTVCVPGTTQCTKVNGVLVDTGSEGLRILSSALGSLPLPAVTQNGNPLGECAPFVGAVTWGPVQSADVEIAGEKASSVPIQVIGGGTGTISGVPPPSCTKMGTPEQDLNGLGANGILGIGPFVQDCGTACATSSLINLGWYYVCSSSSCSVTTASIQQQVENPVAAFSTDNNGVAIQLPSVPDATAQTSLTGSLIFGIGTQSNNALNGATVYLIDPTTGNIATGYGSTLYSSYIDSGSGAIFFLDPQTTGLPTNCTISSNLYCPSSDVTFSAANVGADGTVGPSFNFTVGNADTLLSNPNDGVANGLAGPSQLSPSQNDYFDWGLPFFYGRTVFTAISGAGSPAGPGPYYAY